MMSDIYFMYIMRKKSTYQVLLLLKITIVFFSVSAVENPRRIIYRSERILFLHTLKKYALYIFRKNNLCYKNLDFLRFKI